MKLINERIVTNAEAREILERLGKPDDMKYEQKNSLDMLKKNVKIDAKTVKEMTEELGKMNKLRERQIVAIIDAMPQDRDDLRTVLQKEYSSFTDDEISLILETILKFKKPSKTG